VLVEVFDDPAIVRALIELSRTNELAMQAVRFALVAQAAHSGLWASRFASMASFGARPPHASKRRSFDAVARSFAIRIHRGPSGAAPISALALPAFAGGAGTSI
jgi:hypothetical protein